MGHPFEEYAYHNSIGMQAFVEWKFVCSLNYIQWNVNALRYHATLSGTIRIRRHFRQWESKFCLKNLPKTAILILDILFTYNRFFTNEDDFQ